MPNLLNHLITYLALHYVGALAAAGAGYIVASGLARWANKRMKGPTGLLIGLSAIAMSYGFTLVLGGFMYLAERDAAGPGYGELLSALFLNHWLVAIIPAYVCIVRLEPLFKGAR